MTGMVLPQYGDPLTDHEIEILTAVSFGLSDRQIAKRLLVAESTVRTHLKKITIKLGSKNRAHMVRIGFAKGHLRIPKSSLEGIR